MSERHAEIELAPAFTPEVEAQLRFGRITPEEFHKGVHAMDSCVVAIFLAAQHGLRVLPIRSKIKVPRILGWPELASRDIGQIMRWRDQFGCDFAILTGRENNVFVLDVDGAQGAEDLARLEETLGPLPATTTCNSGRMGGGFHKLLRQPAGTDDVRNQQPLAGTKIDVRGWHGYAVTAGSLHKSGNRYTWAQGFAPDQVGIAECPTAWWEWLPKKEYEAAIGNRVSRNRPRTFLRRGQHDSGSLLIGDGAGFGGFENPIYKNAIQYFFKAGGEAPAEPIIEVLKKMIIEAPKGPGRDVSRYLNGLDLPRIVERAREFANEVKEDDGIEEYDIDEFGCYSREG